MVLGGYGGLWGALPERPGYKPKWGGNGLCGGGALSFNVNYLNTGPFFLSVIADYQYISTPQGLFSHLSGMGISLKLGYNL